MAAISKIDSNHRPLATHSYISRTFQAKEFRVLSILKGKTERCLTLFCQIQFGFGFAKENQTSSFKKNDKANIK